VLLTHVLHRQDGVITYAQALECGLSGRQIEHRKATGGWLRVGPRVYFIADRVFADRARLRTAVYSAGTGAAADGLSAAWWLGLVDWLPGTVTVTVRGLVDRRNLGRHGSRAAGELLVVAADRAGSHAERLLIRLFREAGICGWRTGYRVQATCCTSHFLRQKLAIEVDG